MSIDPGAVERRVADLEQEVDTVTRAKRDWLQTVDALGSPMVVHDSEFRIIRANKAYAERAGRDYRDLIGRPYFECFPLRPGPLPRCLRRQREDPDLHPCEEAPEEEFKLPGGEIFVAHAYQMGLGKRAQTILIFEEITERRRYLDALAQQERHHQKLIDGASDAFFVISNAGVITYRSASARRLTGYDDAEIVGQALMRFVSSESSAAARQAFANVLTRAGTEVRAELRLVRKDGVRIDVEASARSLQDDPDIRGVVVTVRDISARKRGEAAIQRAHRALRTLSAGNTALVHAVDEHALLGDMCRVLVEVGGYCLALVACPSEPRDGGQASGIAVLAACGLETAAAQAWAARPAGGHGNVITQALDAGSMQMKRSRQRLPSTGGTVEPACKTLHAELALPLRIEGQAAFGVIYMASADDQAFDDAEMKLLQELAGDLAFGIQTVRSRVARLQAEAKLRESLERTIEAIAATVEARDPYTAGHQRRVAKLAAAIASEMGLPPAQVEGIHFGALIHDLGKIQVPAEILAKPTHLSRIEFELIKQHPQAGYDILKAIDFPWPVGQMVLQHHERLDGSGYPQGLKGDEIALESRILAVADVVEAVATHRPYRPSMGIDAALREISARRGLWFDEAAVDACLRLFKERGFTLASD